MTQTITALRTNGDNVSGHDTCMLRAYGVDGHHTHHTHNNSIEHAYSATHDDEGDGDDDDTEQTMMEVVITHNQHHTTHTDDSSDDTMMIHTNVGDDGHDDDELIVRIGDNTYTQTQHDDADENTATNDRKMKNW